MKVKRRILLLAAGLAALLAVGYFLDLALQHRRLFVNFGEVVPGKIYRSGQVHPRDLESISRRYGVKTIICLRGEEDKETKESAQRLGIKLVGLSLTAKYPPAPKQLKLIMQILSEKPFQPAEYSDIIKDQLGLEPSEVKLPGPFLVHCAMGADRTGYIIALYRVCFQGWSTYQARFEMLRYFHLPRRFPHLWQDLKNLSPGQFCPIINPNYKPSITKD
jgi:protein tyrosine/serine phosphatase